MIGAIIEYRGDKHVCWQWAAADLPPGRYAVVRFPDVETDADPEPLSL